MISYTASGFSECSPRGASSTEGGLSAGAGGLGEPRTPSRSRFHPSIRTAGTRSTGRYASEYLSYA